MVDPLPTGPQLIVYPARLGGDVASVQTLLDTALQGAFDGVHLLPFYLPYDGADAGFDPQDHTAIDPRLGTWADVRRLSRAHLVMADVIVNHMSTRSPQFVDVAANGAASPWYPMFLTLSSVFPDGATEDDLATLYRPRPGLPFTAMTLGGRRRLVWTTFTPEQADLDAGSPATWQYLTSVMDTLIDAGVGMLRLDALGYAGKEPGTNCFMTATTRALTDRIVGHAHERGARILVEVHGHHRQQIDIAARVDYVYDFALPPLVLHALTAADLEPLAHWLRIRPQNTVTVLDTHDGIGIVDVGISDLRPGEPGLLTADQIDALVERIHTNSGGTSRTATGAAASNLDLYQVNCTLYDALARDDRRHLLHGCCSCSSRGSRRCTTSACSPRATTSTCWRPRAWGATSTVITSRRPRRRRRWRARWSRRRWPRCDCAADIPRSRAHSPGTYGAPRARCAGGRAPTRRCSRSTSPTPASRCPRPSTARPARC